MRRRSALPSIAMPRLIGEVKRLESWITGATSMLDDPAEIERKISSLTESKPVIEHRRSQAELDGKLLGTQLPCRRPRLRATSKLERRRVTARELGTHQQ